MSQETREKRITPLSELDAHALIRKWYHIGDKIRMGDIHVNPLYARLFCFGKKYVPRGGVNHKLAGVYIDYEKLLVVTSAEPAPKLLYAPTKEIYSSPGGLDYPHGSRGEEELKKIADIYIRIGDLPETPFWEGDTVTITHDQNHEYGRAAKWLLTEICYAEEGGLREESGYMLRSCGDIYGREYHCANSITLFERGNLWKFEHGEPMEFASIEEEAKFYKSLGMSQKVGDYASKVKDGRGQSNPNCIWKLESAINCIREGRGDEMKIKDRGRMDWVVIKYDNEVFGKRMRAHTLAKFGLAEEVAA